MADREFNGRSIAAAAAATVGLMVSVSVVINGTLGVFLKPIAESFEWSRTEVSAGNLIYSWTMALLFPFSGKLMDRFGVKAVLLPGTLLLGAVLIGLATQPGSLLVFYGLFFLIGVCGASTGPVPCSKLISGWFHRRRGLILACTAMGSALAAGVLPQLVRHVIQTSGWRDAYLGLAAYVLVLGLPVIFFLMSESPVVVAARKGRTTGGQAHAAAGLGLTAAEAYRTPAFVLCAVTVALAILVNAGVSQHVVALLTDRNVPLTAAVSFASMAALGGAVSRLLEGVLLDHITSPKLAAVFAAVALTGLLLLHHGGSAPYYLAAGLLFGAGIAGEHSLIPYFVTRFFGLKAFAQIYGSIWSGAAIANGIGPIIMAQIYDRTGSYEVGLWAAEAGIVLTGICFLLLPAYRFAARLPAFSKPDPAVAEDAKT